MAHIVLPVALVGLAGRQDHLADAVLLALAHPAVIDVAGDLLYFSDDVVEELMPVKWHLLGEVLGDLQFVVHERFVRLHVSLQEGCRGRGICINLLVLSDYCVFFSLGLPLAQHFEGLQSTVTLVYHFIWLLLRLLLQLRGPVRGQEQLRGYYILLLSDSVRVILLFDRLFEPV